MKSITPRIIKFRAFDKVAKAMSPEFVLFGEFLLLGAIHDWQREVRGTSSLLQLMDSLEDLEIMQFTGVLDKNENDIFEGDILKCDNRPSSIGIVVYDNDAFKIQILSGVFWKLRHKQAKFLPEIIGNIYSNPELLNTSTVKK